MVGWESQQQRKDRKKREYWERVERQQAEKNERYRYLPASYRARDELAEIVGDREADAVKALIEAMIQERHDR